MAELQAARVRLQSSSTEFSGVQTALVDLVNRRKQVDAQLIENENVKHEFDKLDTSSDAAGESTTHRTRIYKVTGPILLEQELGEARSTVSRRLQLLGEERDRLEVEVKKMVERAQRLQGEIVSARSEVDSLVGAPAAAQQGSEVPAH